MMYTLVVASGLETGFVGDWCCNGDTEDILRAYETSWSYSFDRRLVLDFAQMPPTDLNELHIIFKFKFTLSLDDVTVHCFVSDDLITLVAQLTGKSVITSARSLALPVSRYVISHKMNLNNLPANFRNLRELAIKLKNEIFLPLRNEIFSVSTCKSPYPSFHGLPADVIMMILPHLKLKDVASVALVCHDLKAAVDPFLKRNKPPGIL
jgi:hypothetical protein